MDSIVLNSKTYAYSSDKSGVQTWSERSGGVPTGFSNLSLSLSEIPVSKTQLPGWRVEGRLLVPIVATSDDVCACTGAVLRTSLGKFSSFIPATGSVAERLDFALRMKDLLANAYVLAMEETLTRPG